MAKRTIRFITGEEIMIDTKIIALTVFKLQHEMVQTPVVTSTKVYLPATANTWRIYGLAVSPIKANTKGFLKPAKFGGLSYPVLKNRGSNVYEIQTAQFGRVQIYASATTGATVK
ncbi:hypothetical protein HCA15_14070 [Listeria booriae]|uniref:hypothetical protein n=1 Tax=Listeria booriae TaxID=1552123 RepID=UPI00162483E6|nr:hypothetical protein [Listeria booriae]MBC1945115.1 hypothetical protein [Listeria booriae]MBC6167775.1 hypothetical protein [Listeria booriae]